MSNMHNNLRFFRMAQNLKQKTIADLLKMSQPNYSNLENGKTKLTSDTAEKLAGYFRVSQDALLNQKQLLTNQIGGEFQIDNNTAQYFETNKEFFDPILARMEILLNLLADEKEELAIERMQLTEVFDKLANKFGSNL